MQSSSTLPCSLARHLVQTAALLMLLIPPSEAAAAEFSLLSYNTHGLHRWISRDDPERRFPSIGAIAQRGYDVVLLQEVFVTDYYQRLAFGPDWAAYRGNGARSGPIGLLSYCDACGSGLAAAIHQPLVVDQVGREPFPSCAGKIRGAHDCWATKGLLFLRVRLPDGGEVDLYDLHLDAGDRGADYRARRAQIAVVQRAIDANSAGRPVIVAGDFNLKQAVARDRALLESFRQQAGLTDAQARPSGAQWTEIIDYILYRSGTAATLALLGAGEATEMVSEGVPLSDHPAVFARFRLETK